MIFFPYKSVMLVSIYLLKLKIKPPVLAQNPQDTLHSLSCVNICTKDPALKIFFKIMLNLCSCSNKLVGFLNVNATLNLII